MVDSWRLLKWVVKYRKEWTSQDQDRGTNNWIFGEEFNNKTTRNQVANPILYHLIFSERKDQSKERPRNKRKLEILKIYRDEYDKIEKTRQTKKQTKQLNSNKK